jgi:hypothetical protein
LKFEPHGDEEVEEKGERGRDINKNMKLYSQIYYYQNKKMLHMYKSGKIELTL